MRTRGIEYAKEIYPMGVVPISCSIYETHNNKDAGPCARSTINTSLSAWYCTSSNNVCYHNTSAHVLHHHEHIYHQHPILLPPSACTLRRLISEHQPKHDALHQRSNDTTTINILQAGMVHVYKEIFPIIKYLYSFVALDLLSPFHFLLYFFSLCFFLLLI